MSLFQLLTQQAGYSLFILHFYFLDPLVVYGTDFWLETLKSQESLSNDRNLLDLKLHEISPE